MELSINTGIALSGFGNLSIVARTKVTASWWEVFWECFFSFFIILCHSRYPRLTNSLNMNMLHMSLGQITHNRYNTQHDLDNYRRRIGCFTWAVTSVFDGLFLVQIYFSALRICHVQTKYQIYCHEPVLLCLRAFLAQCILQPGMLNNQLQNVLLSRKSLK